MKLTYLQTLTRSPLKLALATVLVAAASAATFPVMAQPMGGHGGGHMGAHMGGPGSHGGHRGGGMGSHFSERLLDEVKASADQKAQIKQIMEAARKDLAAQHEAGRALHQESMRVFTQPNVDANAVEALRQKRLAQHDQATRRMSQAMLEASRVLTPDQRRQLADKMQQRQQMMERHRKERQALDGPKS